MALLSRDQILIADDLKFEDVDVPEWQEGGQVRVRRLTGAERDKFEAGLVEAQGTKNQRMNTENIRARLIVASAIDEQGRKLFTPDDVRLLGRKSAAPLDRLFDACQRLSGLSDDDVARLAENFGETADDADSSD